MDKTDEIHRYWGCKPRRVYSIEEWIDGIKAGARGYQNGRTDQYYIISKDKKRIVRVRKDGRTSPEYFKSDDPISFFLSEVHRWSGLYLSNIIVVGGE